jgi:dipeptidyl aminopeptidase/acylaminoacyl peptidase
MRIIRNPELKGILAILLIALALGVLLAGMSGKLEQWGLPWFTGARAVDKIVFVSDRSGTREIYIMNLDGSGQKALTRKARVLSAPTMTASGNRIAFVGMCGKASQVLAVGINGGTPYALTSSTGPKREPRYSPDGKKLAYIESGRVYSAELNGSNPEPVLPTHAEMIAAMGNPEGRSSIPMYTAYSWAPDGEGVAGVSSQDRVSDSLKYLAEPEGEALLVMPSEPMMRSAPSLAWDRMRVRGIAWAGKENLLAATVELGHDDIVVAFYPGEERLDVLTRTKDIVFGAPAVSPDGSVVVVPIEGAPDKQEPGLVRIDVETKRTGILCKGEFEKPVFSPDGGTILAAQYDAKTRKRAVVTIDPASGKITRLADKGDCFDAVWSPMSER